jgi:sec-independent protein translocase protein TatA
VLDCFEGWLAEQASQAWETRTSAALKKKVVKSETSSPEEEFMFGLGMPELIIIMVIFLIVFGAGKLPEIGAGMGKAIKNFKNATSENEHEAPEKIEA